MDIKISWQTQEADTGIFSEIGELMSEVESKKLLRGNRDVNLDVMVACKSTTSRRIADYLLSRVDPKTPTLSWWHNFVSCALLCAISLKGNDMAFFEDNEFREIFSLFESKYGEKYIKKSAINEIEGASDILDMMCRKGILKQAEDVYYVVGHLLKNVQIGKTEHPAHS